MYLDKRTNDICALSKTKQFRPIELKLHNLLTLERNDENEKMNICTINQERN